MSKQDTTALDGEAAYDNQQTNLSFPELCKINAEIKAKDKRIAELEAALRDIEGRSRPKPTGNPKWINEHARQALEGGK